MKRCQMYYYAETSRGFRGFADEAHVEFPGDAALARHVETLCAEKLAALTDYPEAFDVWYVAPDSWLWRSGITDAHCFAERRDGTAVGSIATRTSDN